MKTVTLHILAEDIKTTNYLSQENCAITRALQRAGINAKDCGVRIKSLDTGLDIGSNKAASSKVVAMYRHPSCAFPLNNWGIKDPDYIREPADFSFDVELDID